MSLQCKWALAPKIIRVEMSHPSCRNSNQNEKKDVKDMIFILNPNPTSLSFLESWLFKHSIRA